MAGNGFDSDDGSSIDDDFEDDSFDSEPEDDDRVTLGVSGDAESKPEAKKLSKHLVQLQHRLGLEDLKKRREEENSKKDVQPTPSTPTPKVIVYSDPRKRKNLRDEQKALTAASRGKGIKQGPPSDKPPEFDLIRAKHEVARLTIRAMKKKATKEEAQATLAISLGALPPKKKPVNYKVLKETRKREQEELKKLQESEHVFVKRIQAMTKKKPPKKDKNKVANFDAGFGKVGSDFKRKMKNTNRTRT